MDPFKVPQQEQPKVAARRQARPAHHRGVECAALRFHKGIEPVRIEQRVLPAGPSVLDMIANAAFSQTTVSQTGNPQRKGFSRSSPLIAITPLSPWMIWSYAGLNASGPVCPKPEVEAWISLG